MPKQYSQRPLEPKQYHQPQYESLSSLYSGPRFTDQLEARYFQYYCTEIAVDIAANCRSPIWDRIIPQAGESESFIGHGIAALGAFSLSDKMSTNYSVGRERMSVGAPAAMSNPHYQYALIQYCKALKMMQEGLQRKIWGRTRTSLVRFLIAILFDCIRKATSKHASYSNSVKHLLKPILSQIASLVIFCVESLMGNADSASIHASRSINLIYQWRFQHAKSDKALCAQDAFEEDLYPAFPGLDLQALLHLDDRTKHVHLDLARILDAAMTGAPKILTTLNNCVISGQLLLRRNLHFIAGHRLDSYPNIGTISEFSVAHSKSRWSVALGHIQVPNSQRVAQKAYLAEINSYKADLEDFLKASSNSDSSIAFYACTICKIHTAMNTILLTGACFPPRTSWDSLLPDFQDIVTLCEKIYPQASANGGSTYTFDMGLIVPLAVVAIRCRDITLKKRAVGLLLSKPGYREGIWDAEAMGNICEWFIEIEEEARLNELSYVAGGIEGEGRLVKDDAATEHKVPTLLMVQFELNERKARVVCAMPDRGKKAERAIQEKVISW